MPVAGGLYDMYQGALDGNGWKIGIGAAMVVFDVVTGGEGTAAKNGGAEVFRAVSNAELKSINELGQFTLQQGGVESKYFAKSIEDAQWWGQNLYPDGFTIVKGVTTESIGHFWSPYTDGLGAYIISKEFLPKIIPYRP